LGGVSEGKECRAGRRKSLAMEPIISPQLQGGTGQIKTLASPRKKLHEKEVGDVSDRLSWQRAWAVVWGRKGGGKNAAALRTRGGKISQRNEGERGRSALKYSFQQLAKLRIRKKGKDKSF